MATKDKMRVSKTKKRKRISPSTAEADGFRPKLPEAAVSDSKPTNSYPSKDVSRVPFRPVKQQKLRITEKEKKIPVTSRERRLQAKELAQARKKKRKRHFTLEQDLAHLWEKMRRSSISKEDRSRLVSEALGKMKGKIPEIAGSHVTSRVLQTCVKYCSQDERNVVFEELRPHFLTLAASTYAVHLVKKMLDNASKKQLADFISSLHGHVASLLRHMVGSVVVEHAYQLGNVAQKQELLLELYSTELQLFKDLVSLKESRLVDVISKLNLQKSSVTRHMTSVIQPVLEKGIVDHSIIHRLLMEYFSIADQSSVRDIIQQLSGPLLLRMIGTRDGARIGVLCVKYGSAKERKKIIKGLKGYVEKIARDQHGCMVLVGIVSVVDDTKLVTKIICRELQPILKELLLDQSGRRVLLQLLHPNCSRFLNPDALASLNLTITSVCTRDQAGEISLIKPLNSEPKDAETTKEDSDKTSFDDCEPVETGKKDPFVRRQELLINSGLAESIIDICIESADELLRSKFGKECVYEVAMGGSDGILKPTLDDKINALHESISSLAANSKEGSEEEHILENFHSSRTIRKLVLDCPKFASKLWDKALKGKVASWAEGHSSKVVSAYLESSHQEVREVARYELQPLIDKGVLKSTLATRD